MANPTATSATVIAMVNRVNTSPARSARNRANATRLMLTALSISSMPSRIPTAFRRVRTPKSPMTKTSAARTRYAASGTSVLRPREVERAEQCYDQQHAEQLQRHAEGACQRAPQLAQLIAAGDGPRHRAALEDEPHDGCEDRGRQHGAAEDEAARLSDRRADQALGQHDGEHDDGHDTARVEQELNGEQERRVEQKEDAAGGHQRRREPEHRVEEIGRQHDGEACADQHHRRDAEPDDFGHSGFAVGAPSEASGARRSGELGAVGAASAAGSGARRSGELCAGAVAPATAAAAGLGGLGGACMSRRRLPVAHDGSNCSPSACNRSLSRSSSRRSAVARSNDLSMMIASVGQTWTHSSQNSHEYSSSVNVLA